MANGASASDRKGRRTPPQLNEPWGRRAEFSDVSQSPKKKKKDCVIPLG